MKKQILLSALVGLLAISVLAYIWFRPEPNRPFSYYDAFPKFDQIITKYFSTYHYHRYWSDRDLKDGSDSERESEIIRFAKKPDGWHIQFYVYDPVYKVTFDKLFWSAKKGDYVEVADLLKAKSDGAEVGDGYRFQLGEEKDKYDDRVFYGYEGWQDDVLSRFDESTDSLRDYMMGGIYWACNELAHAYAGGVQDFRFMSDTSVLMKQGGDPISMFKKYKERSLKVADMMLKKATSAKNPDPETISKLKLMYMEGIIDYHFMMASNKREKEVLPYFKETAFDIGTLNVASNLLNSCKPNSVLMIGSTWMTAHMIYLQEVRGMKRDVLVVDNMLLNYYGYFSYIKDKADKSVHARFTVPEDMYNKHQLSRILVSDNGTYTSDDLKDVLKRITRRASKASDTDFVRIDRTYYKLEVDLKACKDNGVIDSGSYNTWVKNHSYSYYGSSSSASTTKTISWHNNNEMMPAGGVFFMDLLLNNIERFPIYVSPGCSDPQIVGATSIREDENLVYRIDPLNGYGDEEDYDVDYDSEYDYGYSEKYRAQTEKLYQYYMKTFTWKGSDKPDGYEYMVADHYRADIAQAALRFTDPGDKSKAEELMNRAETLFPLSKYPYGPGVTSVSRYYKLHRTEEARTAVLDSAEAHLDGRYHLLLHVPLTDDMPQYMQADTADALDYIERARLGTEDLYD